MSTSVMQESATTSASALSSAQTSPQQPSSSLSSSPESPMEPQSSEQQAAQQNSRSSQSSSPQSPESQSQCSDLSPPAEPAPSVAAAVAAAAAAAASSDADNADSPPAPLPPETKPAAPAEPAPYFPDTPSPFPSGWHSPAPSLPGSARSPAAHQPGARGRASSPAIMSNDITQHLIEKALAVHEASLTRATEVLRQELSKLRETSSEGGAVRPPKVPRTCSGSDVNLGGAGDHGHGLASSQYGDHSHVAGVLSSKSLPDFTDRTSTPKALVLAPATLPDRPSWNSAADSSFNQADENPKSRLHLSFVIPDRSVDSSENGDSDRDEYSSSPLKTTVTPRGRRSGNSGSLGSDDEMMNAPLTPLRRPSLGGGRRPSLGNTSVASSKSGTSKAVNQGEDEEGSDDEQLKILPCWEKKIKGGRTPRQASRASLQRRPSLCSNPSQGSELSILPTDFSRAQVNSPSKRKPLGLNAPPCRTAKPPVVVSRIDKLNAWGTKALNSLVLYPNSPRRMCWDVLSAILIFVDFVWIPLQALQPGDPEVMRIETWLGTAFWTINVPVSFLSGFNVEGVAELRPSRIAKHYLHTWLVFDVVTALADWVATTVTIEEGPLKHILPLMDMVRLLRLPRLLLASTSLNTVFEFVRSESWRIIFNLVKRVCTILMLTHLVACMWYLIGRPDVLAMEESWIVHNGVQVRPFSYRYTTSLHWALTQFTPASMEVTPVNSLERAYNICVVIVAMVTFSSLVSTITNAMNRLQALNSERVQRMSNLRKYLRQHKISVDLTARVWSCSESALHHSKQILHNQDVEVLASLPNRLKADLYEEVFGPVVLQHPFFFRINAGYHVLARKLFCLAVNEVALPKSRELFMAGETGECLYFLVSGKMTYHDTRSEVANTPGALPSKVDKGMWVCEPVLWIQWKHVGQMAADQHCELMATKSAKVQDILKRLEEPQRYAREYVAFFQKNPTLLSDVWLDTELIQNMVERAFTTLQEEGEESDCAMFSSPSLLSTNLEYGPSFGTLPGMAGWFTSGERPAALLE